MKQTIEEAAKMQADSRLNGHDISAFIRGAKSDAAKELHTQGMYSEEELKLAFQAGQNYENFDCQYAFNEWIKDYKKKRNGTT